MKKQYLRLKAKLIIVVVVAMLLCCFIITYLKADQIRGQLTSECNEEHDFLTDLRISTSDTDSSATMTKKAYEAYRTIHAAQDIGFYSMLKSSDGNTLAETQYFLIVKKNNQEQDERILLLGDELFTDNSIQLEKKKIQDGEDVRDGKISFALQAFTRMEIKGTCDETFIYPEEVIWETTSGTHCCYYPVQKDVAYGSMPFEAWAGTGIYDEEFGGNNQYIALSHSASFPYGDWKRTEALNKEAKELCIEIYDAFVNKKDTVDNQSEDGLFTCVVAKSGYLNKNYTMPYVYVFHPVNIAMKELIGIYIGVILFGIAVIILVCILVQKVYQQQLDYEQNRQTLTRGVAHELKTPLAIAKGYLENWNYMEVEEQENCSQTMIEEIEYMNKMVMDLLELSRLEAKAKKLQIESVDLYALTQSVLKRMNKFIEEKGLEITVVHEDDEYLCDADLELMRTVLVNLITNALKFANKEIKIEFTKNKKKITISIINDGEMILAEKIEHVWDEFYKEESTEKQVIKSSGLGLAITKNILILHNAKYGCASVNENTKFWFTI